MNPKVRKQLIKVLKERKDIPEDYKNILFPETKKEYELVYGDKERKENILAETMRVPFQEVKTFRNGAKAKGGWINKLIFGDDLQALKELMYDPEVKGKVRLVYIDPPFATKQEFRGSQDQKAYQDKIAGAKFLEFLRKRLIFLREILADDGSIYVHLDWKKAHYVKVLMDEIFGEQNFIREVIWNRMNPSGGKAAAENWIHTHDNILFYAKNKSRYVFNKQYEPYTEEYIKERFVYEDKKGKYRIQGTEKRKQYLSESKGKALTSVWNIADINVMALEKSGFPTQKPETLLERIIKASSNPDGVVLDAFAGSGTTLAVAEKLSRRWIGIDSSKLAIYTIQKRLLNLRKEIGNKGSKITPKPFTLYNAGLYDYQKLKKLPFEQYREFVLKLFQCRDEKHTISGIDLDGYLGKYDVLVYDFQKYKNAVLDYGFIDDLHKSLGDKIGEWFFIIAPSASFQFLENIVERGKIKYFALGVPYSIIDELHRKPFEFPAQVKSEKDINNIFEGYGFDFIQVPKIRCRYYLAKPRRNNQLKIGQPKKEAVIKIKTFKSETISRKPNDFKNLETLSMVMINYNYNGKIFDLDEVFYDEDIKNQSYEVCFDPAKIEDKMMIIYIDIFGNEKREIKTLKDFKK